MNLFVRVAILVLTALLLPAVQAGEKNVLFQAHRSLQ